MAGHRNRPHRRGDRAVTTYPPTCRIDVRLRVSARVHERHVERLAWAYEQFVQVAREAGLALDRAGLQITDRRDDVGFDD